jgi:predicted alternative tryptophan synthase beta-subunit
LFEYFVAQNIKKAGTATRRHMGRKRCNCNPNNPCNLGIQLNEALENMMQKGPTGVGS